MYFFFVKKTLSCLNTYLLRRNQSPIRQLKYKLNNYALIQFKSHKFRLLLDTSNRFNPIDRILNVLGLITGSTTFISNKTSNVLFKTAKKMLDLFYNQHVNDPWKYSSHDFTHSCRTQDILKSLFKSIPDFRRSLHNYFKQQHFSLHSTNEYLSSQKIGLFCSEMTCLLHDIGYPSQQLLGLQKSNHTIEGMRLIEQLLETDLKQLFLCLGLTNNQSLFLLNEIKKGVLCHGADKVQDRAHYTHELDCGCASMWVQKDDVKHLLENPFFLKSFSIKPTVSSNDVRFADAYLCNDNKLGIKFEPVDLVKDPINASIRFCDNLDTTCYRLKEDQLDFSLSALDVLSKTHSNFNNTIYLETLENTQDPITNHFDIVCPDPNYEIKQLKYFLGLLPIESISFKFDSIKDTIIVIFNFNKRYTELQNIYVLDESKDDIKLVDFYFGRIKDSLQSITFNSQPILFEKSIDEN